MQSLEGISIMTLFKNISEYNTICGRRLQDRDAVPALNFLKKFKNYQEFKLSEFCKICKSNKCICGHDINFSTIVETEYPTLVQEYFNDCERRWEILQILDHFRKKESFRKNYRAHIEGTFY